jgi:hypothetical protein
MYAERIAARLFTVAGGMFWIIAAFAAEYSFRDQGVVESAGTAALPLAITVAVFVIGWYNELLVSMLLGAGVLAMIAWGVSFAWEPNVWILMSIFFIGPMAVAGVLYYLAARMERICEDPSSVGDSLWRSGTS